MSDIAGPDLLNPCCGAKNKLKLDLNHVIPGIAPPKGSIAVQAYLEGGTLSSWSYLSALGGGRRRVFQETYYRHTGTDYGPTNKAFSRHRAIAL